jgi:hypothetical protein
MSKAKLQDCIDSAGRLAIFIDALGATCALEDVLMWCAEANVALYTDREIAATAFQAFQEFDK